jgi:hypothetical protein
MNTLKDGPIEYQDGDKRWYLNDLLHREGGPAIERPDGSEYWYLNGRLHREDGPAICGPNITCGYYLEGQVFSEEEYLKADASKYPKLLAYQVMHG